MISSPEGTIVAVATPPGRGAIALLRLSGPNAHELATRRFRPRGTAPLVSRQPRLGHFLDAHGKTTDQVVLTLFTAPATYTGENMVEIGCHGSPAITRHLVEELLRQGARLAEPGEYTLRAFLNGKLDLAQAEAVRDLVESQTSFQARVAAQQLEGRLSRRLQPIKAEMIRILCHMETALEFVETEADPLERRSLLEALAKVDEELSQLEKSFRVGRLVQEGVRVSIAGKPNAGKSSLFNRLIGENRAIVTAIPGTTRDALTETVEIAGLPVTLADTAGIREAEGLVEKLGMEKSLEHLSSCEVALFLVDGSVPFTGEDRRAWEAIKGQNYLVVVNKEDLPLRMQVPHEVEAASAGTLTISAKHGTHLEDLRGALVQAATGGTNPDWEGVMVTNVRHQDCLRKARHHLHKGLDSYREGMSEEFPLYDFRQALEAFGHITGETSVEDILQQIFSTFCIGK